MSGNSEYEDKKSNVEERFEPKPEVSDALRKFDEAINRLRKRESKDTNEAFFY